MISYRLWQRYFGGAGNAVGRSLQLDGAAPRLVVRLVLSRVASLLGSGVILGAVVSLWLSPLVGTLLYSLEPRDAFTLAGAAGILVGVGGCASWLPARRTSSTRQSVCESVNLT